MKLYFSPGACSLSPHIVLHELNIAADYVEVDTLSKATKDGGNLRSINPKGTVPTLVLDDGQVLTEGAVIVQFLADRAPEAGLIPRYGTLARYRLQEWLNYIASEVHPVFGQMFRPDANDASREQQRERLVPKLDYLNAALGGMDFLMGDRITVVDAYLITVLLWTIPTKIDLGRWAELKAYYNRVVARPAVQSAMRQEGLIP